MESQINSINQEDIIDTKVVNNITYNLVLCKENDTKMKLWIPEYFIKKSTNEINTISKMETENNNKKRKSYDKPQNQILTTDDKIAEIYRKLNRANEEEALIMKNQVVQLNLHNLPESLKPEINAMIIKIMESYQCQHKILRSLVKKLRENILLEEFVNKRRKQLSVLFCLEKEINLISKSDKKISVVNFTDLEILPFDFSYINSNIAGEDVVFPKNPPIGCDCIGKNICLLNNCCPEMFNSQPTYNERGEVMVSPHMPIYECNKNCKCMKLCSNRVVQRGSYTRLTIFRTKKCGWGVRTEEFIKRGTFVVEYVGKIIKRKHSIQMRQKETTMSHYLFDLNFNNKSDDSLYSINSSEHGNISRFINHSCDPNLNLYSVWINSSDPNIYHIALFAARNVQPGEELTFHYGYLFNNSEPIFDECKCISCSNAGRSK